MSFKIYRRLRKGIRKSKFRYHGRCNICGHRTIFFGYDAMTLTKMRYRNDLICVFCGSIARQRALAVNTCALYSTDCFNLKELKKILIQKNISVHNAASQGVLHDFLHNLYTYTCSEYFSEVSPGTIHNGIRCEDMQNLSFQNNSLDLLISEDVMEHVRNPVQAFKSIHRVLKPGGYHVFTVPIYREHTCARVDISTDVDTHILPPFYHGDPIRSGGSLAYNDFGEDIVLTLDANGFESRLFKYNIEDENYKCGHVIVSKKIE